MTKPVFTVDEAVSMAVQSAAFGREMERARASVVVPATGPAISLAQHIENHIREAAAKKKTKGRRAALRDSSTEALSPQKDEP